MKIKNTISYFERLTVTEDREYIIRTPLASACVHIFHLDKRGYSRTKLTCVKPICDDLIMIPKDIAVGSTIEIEYEYLDVEREKQMTKSDLKTGMMVTFKNGTSGIILKDTEDGDIVSMNGTYRKLADWNEDLSHGKISNLDIDSIWGNDVPNGCLFFDDARWNLKELIKSTKELTIDEIEKKLGYKIKIVNRI